MKRTTSLGGGLDPDGVAGIHGADTARCLHPLRLFDLAKSQGRPLFSSAPMVRYSKLAFRQTVHEYGTDLCWTPMILAKEFNRSAIARDSDFTISPSLIPTIVQFGASSAQEFARASLLVAPFCEGIDINCGCPQSWACAENLGAALMNKRETVAEMLISARSLLSEHGLTLSTACHDHDRNRYIGTTLSVKIRVHSDLRQTIDFVRTVQNAGVDFITIHGRTRKTPSSQPVNLDAIKLVAEHCRVPVIANGDVVSLTRAQQIADYTGVQGVMSSRAILSNPGLYSGCKSCSWDVLESFVSNVIKAPLPFKLVLHHLSEMAGDGDFGDVTGKGDGGALMSKSQRTGLLQCRDMIELIDYLDSIKPLRRLQATLSPEL